MMMERFTRSELERTICHQAGIIEQLRQVLTTCIDEMPDSDDRKAEMRDAIQDFGVHMLIAKVALGIGPMRG